MKKILLNLGLVAASIAPITTVIACGETSDDSNENDTDNSGTDDNSSDDNTENNDADETTPVVEEYTHAYTFSATVEGLGLLDDPSTGGDDYPYTVVEQNGVLANLGNVHKVSDNFSGTTYKDLLNDNSAITISNSYDVFFGLEKIVNTVEEGYYELSSFGMGGWFPFTKSGWDESISNPMLGFGMGFEMSVDTYFNTVFGSGTADALNGGDEYWEYLFANYENVDWSNFSNVGGDQILKYTTYDPYLDAEIKLYDASDNEIQLADTLPDATIDALNITIKVVQNIIS